MRRVCVVGAGASGVAAAREAAQGGASVSLFESREEPMIVGGLRGSAESVGSLHISHLSALGVETDLGTTVASVDERKRVLSSRGREEFDAVVIATGATVRTPRFEGWRIPGVFTLRSADAYPRLREAIPLMRRAAVAGSTLESLTVASRLLDAGLEVSFFPAGGSRSPLLDFDGAVGDAVRTAAELAGLRILDAPIERAAGIGKVEAVLADGTVFASDGVVLVPSGIPRFPPVGAATGTHGGLLVDRTTQTSVRGVYAAGSCAERTIGRATFPGLSGSAGPAMGRVAGSNAAGGSNVFETVRHAETEVFGLEVVRAGLASAEARAAGFLFRETSHVEERVACSLVFEQGTSKVLGAQLAGTGAKGLTGLVMFALSKGVSLRELVYLEPPGSIDITALTETARQGMKRCQRS
ncbi:MAG: FAD-dependent oxidoreductase [Thaumarchaeota archaeon]|nr:FAD-dependent oxidoreductase [Nitrososphaerota archaeon]